MYSFVGIPLRLRLAGCLAAALALACPGSPARANPDEFMEYDITWIGLSVGVMTVQSQTNSAGVITRRIRIWNRPWIARIYPVDNTIECRLETTPQGSRHTVTKIMGEKNFVQNDTLILWPEVGRARWEDAVGQTAHEFTVPPDARDFVSFFFDLRDAAANGQWAGEYQLVMDDDLHALEIQTDAPRVIRTPYGRLEAIRVKAISKSPVLFSRNRPRAVWVATRLPVILFADVETRFGAVRATLTAWEQNEQSRLPELTDEPPPK